MASDVFAYVGSLARDGGISAVIHAGGMMGATVANEVLPSGVCADPFCVTVVLFRLSQSAWEAFGHVVANVSAHTAYMVCVCVCVVSARRRTAIGGFSLRRACQSRRMPSVRTMRGLPCPLVPLGHTATCCTLGRCVCVCVCMSVFLVAGHSEGCTAWRVQIVVFVLATSEPYESGSAQYVWLSAALARADANRVRYPFVVVVGDATGA